MEKSSYRASFGELFQFAFQTLTKNWLAYLIIAAFSLVPALTTIFGGTTGVVANLSALAATGQVDPLAMMSMVGALITAALVGLVLTLIVSPIVDGANFKVAFEAGQKRNIDAIDAIRYGASKWFNLFIAILLASLLGLLPAIAILIMIVVAAMASAASTTLGVILGVAAFIASIVILILYVVKVAFIIPAVVAEDMGFGEALKVSMNLSVRDDFWDVFLKLLLIGLALLTINMVFSFTVGLIPIVGAVLSAILSAIMNLLYNNYIMAYYMDRRSLFAEADAEPELGL